ncbi:MAG: hypothetical protein K0B07_03940 [DPANN group archaeon]|nr:hypothetical protein [DPANN group archaeon]
MSDILVEQLSVQYQPVGLHKNEQISIYPFDGGRYVERIYVDIIDKIFFGVDKPLVTFEEITGIAEAVFDDVHFAMRDHSTEGYLVLFKPQGIDKYSLNYDGHDIVIRKPFDTLKITISTGNRGAIGLNYRQREKYFDFVNKVYDLFIEKV